MLYHGDSRVDLFAFFLGSLTCVLVLGELAEVDEEDGEGFCEDESEYIAPSLVAEEIKEEINVAPDIFSADEKK